MKRYVQTFSDNTGRIPAASPEVRRGQAPAFADDRPRLSAVQRRLVDRIGQSSQATAQLAFGERLDNSPHAVAQRQRMNELFGPALQTKSAEDEELLEGKSEPAQRKELDEEEPSHGISGPLQRQTPEEEEIQMRTAAPMPAAQLQPETARARNETGLPDNLKAGIESLSGISMEAVKVHYNSAKPAQLNALAYAQGTDIHVAPGQEKHLPHEAWHVVQQAQGRVKPTMQLKIGVPVNDDKVLEREADVMGTKALQMKAGTRAAVLDSETAIQRIGKEDVTTAEWIEIQQLKETNPKKWPSGESIDEMIDWAQSAEQVRSILNNYTYKEWTAVQQVFKTGAEVPTKVAKIKQTLAAKKAEIRAAAINLFRDNYGKGMAVKDAIADNLIRLEHRDTFRTAQEKADKKNNATGPATREWWAYVDNVQANWVLHIHYNDITSSSVPALHVKPWDTRKDQNSKRFTASLLLPLAVKDTNIDKQSSDLSDHEKKIIT